jgi:predicted dehydrogenase
VVTTLVLQELKVRGENIANIDNAYKYPPGWGESLRKFIYSIQHNEPHPTNFDDNKYTMAIALAAIKSHEERRIVKISEIFDSLNGNSI